jgi:hypothetical protein
VSRLSIVSALEALEVGDQRLAVDILLAALDEGEPVGARENRCACGRQFEWPGLLDAHQLSGLCPATLEEAA